VYEEIVRDFISHGFQNILLFNGHYGNVIPISVALRRLGIDFPNKGLYAIGWFSLGSDVIGKIKKSKVLGGHAGEVETSVTLAIQPENVQLDKAAKELQDIPLSQKWWPSKKPGPRRLIHLPRGFPKMGKNAGVMGDATVATKEFGEKVIEAVVDDLTELLLEIVSVEDKVKGY